MCLIVTHIFSGPKLVRIIKAYMAKYRVIVAAKASLVRIFSQIDAVVKYKD
jgi:hypothetical protein